jgi:excisionase family DNA binding protein
VEDIEKKEKAQFEDRLMTLEDVAEYLQVSKKTVYRLIENDKIPVFRVAHQWRFRKELLDKWLDEGRSGKN